MYFNVGEGINDLFWKDSLWRTNRIIKGYADWF